MNFFQPYIFFICLVILQPFVRAESWGKTGHRAIGEVAQQNLTPKAAQIIDELLGGKSLAFISTFADEIRSDETFNYLEPWHYVNMGEDMSYSESSKNPNGDIVVAINTCINYLKDSSVSKNQKAFYLKLLVHFVGDIHQPLHTGRKEDRGGNDIEIYWFGKKTNIHSLWDYDLIHFFEMSYTELASNLPKYSTYKKKNVMSATVLEWVYESQVLANDIYKKTPAGASLEYVYHYQNFDTVRKRLLEAGLRLAATLNMIFDPSN